MKKLVAVAIIALCLGACAGTTVIAPRVRYNPDGTIEVGVEVGITRVKVTKTTSTTGASKGAPDGGVSLGGVPGGTDAAVTTVTTELVVETSTGTHDE